ncbi:LysR family transcriptional regulator [Modicisalibacter tunisiensis]|uniref:LysR family transcriptional regulator n=1 Tax=Modicisalibacter tunisiensis TaxID=390637 RepID=UPI001CCB6B46|nr:LysR family transcriptional regulator [Modicisalibacter tunisiensis]MBZ9539100.1 LysR family transcriptional regulator [Modicisalibacter tunisiensis]
MVDFKELEAFVWVVRLGSFRKVATRLHLTQPSISDRINRLEAAVGEVLLERSARPIQPTLRGREFFTHAERLLASREEALRLFQNEEAFSGTLRLGIIETIANSWFPDFMRRLAERYPQLTLELTVDISPQLHQRLADNDLDMLFAMDGAAPGLAVEETPLCTYEMGMFIAPQHTDRWRAEGLGALPFISFSRQARPYTELVAYLAEQGLDAPKIHCASTLMTIARMSIEGLGIGVLPVSTVADSVRRGELVRLALPRPLPAMIYETLWRSANYPRFSRSVARLARQCAERYDRDHTDDTALPQVKAWADTENKN